MSYIWVIQQHNEVYCPLIHLKLGLSLRIMNKQAEADIVPSSGLRLRLRLKLGGSVLGLGSLFRLVEWLEIWRVKLISTQVVVEVEVGAELGNTGILRAKHGKEKNC